MGMWIAYQEAYRDKELEARAELKLCESGARILLIALEASEKEVVNWILNA